MAQAPTAAMAMATPTPSVDIPNPRDAAAAKSSFSNPEKLAHALLTPPNSVSPLLSAHAAYATGQSPPMISIDEELDTHPSDEQQLADGCANVQGVAGMPLSRGALSGLDASNTITPVMLAMHHLPGIMLGNGPRPIRYVMGELTQSVPGFSRIPPAKARRLVVAALESRGGGGVDGNVAFCKTGWGRWDAHIKGSSRDSGIGSFNEGHLSPPRSERSSYAISHGDSAVHMPGPRAPSRYRDQHSGASWTASSIREEDELDMDMDVPENEADKMSLDGASDDAGSDSIDSATDEEDWTATSSYAPRKPSVAVQGAPRKNYNAISAAYARRYSSNSWHRRPSGFSTRPLHSSSVPSGGGIAALNQATATPEEQAAVAALLSMGSM
ncbi:hypothetical protein B0A50_06696 [Salinomyces thailandicus]|uniref:Sin3 binding protein n=1 Tax=Salinomyces thailandicus TaxID=706561 RepID=A0A4U0TR41_9PEZI|nr:hypothetical protein B0A50_06696 [Salinomyces thailandica]